MKRGGKPARLQHRWKRKVYVLALLGLCMLTLLLMRSQYSIIAKFATLGAGRPKIAFLFIARNRLPLDLVWHSFFKGEEDRFSIYVHSRPRFLFNKATTKAAYFLNKQVNDSIQVVWGEASMIQAERILLRHALEDPLNACFVFVSDSCIPLYNFSYTYDYIMSSPYSFVYSFADTKEARYNPKMDPTIPAHNWRKGSHWVVLIRKHAKVVVKDDAVFSMFQLHCKVHQDRSCEGHYQNFEGTILLSAKVGVKGEGEMRVVASKGPKECKIDGAEAKFDYDKDMVIIQVPWSNNSSSCGLTTIEYLF